MSRSQESARLSPLDPGDQQNSYSGNRGAWRSAGRVTNLRLAKLTGRRESLRIKAVALMAQRRGKRPARQHLPGESVDWVIVLP
jgi:hypothetical protein